MNRKPGLVGECEGAPPLSGSVLSGTTPGAPPLSVPLVVPDPLSANLRETTNA